jgi:hypothetical protein
MPHVHLPADHSDADLVLAANLADIVGSADLYVTWTHDAGAGAVPEVEAVLRDERRRPRGGGLRGLAAALATLWRQLLQGPTHPAPAIARASASARAGEPRL